MSVIAHTIGTGRKAASFATGLRWTVLDNGIPTANSTRSKVPNGRIRKQAKSLSASKYVITELENVKFLGLYTDPIKGSGKAVTYSIAALMLLELKQHAEDHTLINSMFLLEPPQHPDKRVFVVIEGGQITDDVMLDKEKAVAAAIERHRTHHTITLFSQYQECSVPSETITWTEIGELVGKTASAAELREIPIPNYVYPLALASVLVVGATMGYYYLVTVPAAKKQAAILRAKQDQTPAYLQAASLELSQSGWERKALQGFIVDLRAHPVFVQGWSLERITCDTKICTSQWARKGGLVSNLVQALPDEKIDTTASNLETAYTVSEHEAHFIDLQRDSLKELNETQALLRPVFQTMANVGIKTEVGETQKWVGAGLAGVRPASVLSSMVVNFSLPFFRAAAVIDALPDVVLIKSFSIALPDGSNILRMSIKGTVYARQS